MKKSYKAAYSGILLALSAGISAAESLIPLPLGVKPGFSNIPVMFSMTELNVGISFSICLLKSVFVLFTRGVPAFFMSVTGGIFAFCVMLLIYKKSKASLVIISILGSLAHNIGQIAAACIIMGNTAIIAYLPILIISGVIAGTATGLVLKIILPILRRNQ